ncbi:related to peroxisomal serine-active lipase [Cephalotrichum gorgonifer]|uniref:Related to peroxisomal serine-active lipase n=1 Tax=Cephalotrichum gorgonifer TaxID=2041049 RepID=A0AAE8N049_9PEZI|nr:related to peroxisomal serine-active lipase [Cephalotrichum gorgonifer]
MTDPLETDPLETDPPLLKSNSEIKTYSAAGFTYPNLRIFYRQRDKIDELPSVPHPLPLLVFIHGLGGSAAQFAPLLTSLVPIASCLAIDLPGCGRSEFGEKAWAAYTTEALAELLETIIEDYRDKKAGQNVVLVGHSMGTSLCAYLASKEFPHKTDLVNRISGLVAICPVAGPPAEQVVRKFKFLLSYVPEWLFNLWRRWDRRGGPVSASVERFVGEGADDESKLLQHRFNSQSRTPVWRRMAYGSLPTFEDGVPNGGLPTPETWRNLDVPVFLVAGAADKVTPPSNLDKIKTVSDQDASGKATPSSDTDTAVSTPRPQSQRKGDGDDAGNGTAASNGANGDNAPPRRPDRTDRDEAESEPTTPRTPTPHNKSANDDVPEQPLHPSGVIKTLVMPAPANHALLYMPMTVRILAGNISEFLSTCVTGRLAYSWQLQYLAKEGKWDMKNLAKWQGVAPVSTPIGPEDSPVFVAMKTLREVDDVHCPPVFVGTWGSRVSDVVDISRDQPSYDPIGLQKGDIAYHKMSTVSKIPPTDDEIARFVSLVDSIRESKRRSGQEGTRGLIGVHCHYGFNRTGYFIVCYLVERCGFKVQDAMDAFAKARPPGIRHQHFRDKLFMKYGMLAESKQGAQAAAP